MIITEDHYDISPSGCWEWTGTLDPDGYGRFSEGRHWNLAHRVSQAQHSGEPIPDGMVVDHTCFNRKCINPAHLRVLTVSKNCSIKKSQTSAACRNGHPWDEKNTYNRPGGGRLCRACNLAAAKRYQQRKSA